jgi:hypothetical protein
VCLISHWLQATCNLLTNAHAVVISKNLRSARAANIRQRAVFELGISEAEAQHS